MTPSKTLFFICLSFIVGIFLESSVKIPQLIIWGILVVAVLLIFLSLLTGKNAQIVGFCMLFLVLGILRLQISEFNIASDKLSELNGKGEVTLTGIIFSEPDVRETSQKLNVRVNESTVLVTTGRYPEYKYLDEIKITGKLEAPAVFDDFNYRDYLLKDHIYSVMGFSKIEIVPQKNRYNIFSYSYEKILFLKKKIRESIQNNFLPPQSLILRGIILGDKSAVGQEIKDKFRVTGLSHIIAVSGMHVAVLSSIIMSFLLAIGLWRKHAFYGAVFFIFLYVILVGLPSSAIRAGIMGIVYLAGQAIGRQTISVRIIILAGTLILLFNPLLLFYDVGFQLSFLAVLGLIYLEPIIRNFIKFLTNKILGIKIEKKYENALMIFTVTISAQIFTLPVIIYNFGTISLISPLTNILVVPIIYYVILSGFLSSLAGIVWGALGQLIALPCYFLMKYFLWVIDIFSQPWAHKSISGISWIWVFIFYGGLFFATWFLNKRGKKDFI